MNLKMPNESLQRLIKQYGQAYREETQIARRTKELLPQQLRSLKRRHHVKRKAASAERLALLDDDYREMLDNYLNLAHRALRSRIIYETHKMLLDARQSMRLMHLATRGGSSVEGKPR